MRRGDTPRVRRLVRAYELAFSEERHPFLTPSVSARRVVRLRTRIMAVLPLLSREETDVYYAAVKRLRDAGSFQPDLAVVTEQTP